MSCNAVIFQHSDVFTVKSSQQCHLSTVNKKKTRRFKRHYSPVKKNTVVNLSKHELSEAEISLLEKGLKYCPVPHILDKTSMKADAAHFTRKMRLHDYYHNKPPRENDTEKNGKPKPDMAQFGIESQLIPRFWTPPSGTNQPLDEFCDSITNHIGLIPQRATQDNLTSSEREALKFFIKNINKEIVIRPADKGGALVIQDRNDYINTCNSLLQDENFYERIDSDPTSSTQKNLGRLLSNLSSTYNLEDLLVINDLQNRFPTTGRFYTLPKIHKAGSPPPGRPIVSGNGSVTEIISSFADHFLQELVPALPSFIQDTTHPHFTKQSF